MYNTPLKSTTYLSVLSLCFFSLFNNIYGQVCQGDYTLDTQADVMALAACEKIDGDLTIGWGAVDLTPLANLKEITGNLAVIPTQLTSFNGLQNLESIGGLSFPLGNDIPNLQGLNNVRTITGNISIFSGGLRTFEGLDNLTYIGGNVSISKSSNFQGFRGLEKLEEIGGSLSQYTSGISHSFEGLNSLRKIGGDLNSFKASGDMAGLENLERIEGKLSLGFLSRAANFDKLESLVYVGSLSIVEATVQTINGFPALTHINGSLDIEENFQLTTINAFNALTSVNGSISIDFNPNLAELNAFEAVTHVGENLSITENFALSECCAFYPFLENQIVAALIDFRDNATNCNSISEISTNCNNEAPDLSVRNFRVDLSGVAGEIIAYTFDLDNLGAGTAIGEYMVNVYLSEDPNFSDGDILVGEILTGNTPVGTIANVQGSLLIPEGTIAKNYYLLLVADATKLIDESKEDNNSISRLFVLQTDGGTSGDVIDLELAINTDNLIVSQWSFLDVTITISNRGNIDAHNVKIKLPLKESEVVLEGGAPIFSSLGNIKEWWTTAARWEIPVLAVGQSATLELPLFTKRNYINLYTEVTAADETDLDSTPNNGYCCSPSEDDEANLFLQPNFTDNPTTYRVSGEAASLAIYPVPVQDILQVDLQSTEAQTASVAITNVQGIQQLIQDIELSKGNTNFALNLSDLPSGLYFLTVKMKDKYLSKRFTK